MSIPTCALTIDEALAEAVRSNPEIEAARAAARAIHERVPLALAKRRPVLSIGSGAEFRSDDTPLGTADSENRYLQVSVRQNIYSSGSNSAFVRQADAEVKGSHASVAELEQTVLLGVATSYLDVLRAEGTVQLREAALLVFEAVHRETQAQYRVGDRTQADVAQSEAELTVAAADAAAAKADLETHRARFETLVGRPANGLSSPGEVPDLPESLEEAHGLALEANPAVLGAEHRLQAAKHAVRVAVGDAGPNLGLVGSIRRSDDNGPASPATSLAVSLDLSIPLYQGGGAGARVRQARRVRRQRLAELAAARRAAVQEVTSAWNSLLAARTRQHALNSAVDASQVALDAIRREAWVGERTTREVLDAERNLVSHQARKLASTRDVVVGSYRLRAAIGSLRAAGLGIENAVDLRREARNTRQEYSPGLLFLLRD